MLGDGVEEALGQNRDERQLRYVQTQWTVDDGLPVNSVNDIVQTEDGYLWLATFDGLVRFDGTDFKVYQSGQYDGLPSSRILGLVVRDDGIWMHTESWHVVRFQNGTFTTIAENVDFLYEGEGGALWAEIEDEVATYRDGSFRRVASAAVQGDVRSLLVQSDGTLWVGTTEQGLYRRTPEGDVRHITTEDGLRGQHVRTFTEDQKGRVWIGVTGGLHRWQEGGLVDIPMADSANGPLSVLHVNPDVGGTCLVAAKQGIFRCEDDQLTLWVRGNLSAPSFANGFAQTGPDGQVWVNAETEVYRAQTPVFEAETAVRRIFFDQEENVWIGTASSGLIRLRPSPFTVYGEPEGLASGNIYPIEQRQDGSVWLGTLGGGVSRIGPSGEVATYHPTKNGGSFLNVWALHEDRSGRLWLSGAAGRLCQFEGGGCVRPSTESPIRARIRALYEDRRGRLWAGSGDKGLYRCDQDCGTSSSAWTRFTPENSNLPHPYVRTIHETREGTIWVGTNGGGIARYDEGTFETLTSQDGLSSNLVRDIYQDKTGVLWVATEDRGLNRIELSSADTSLASSIMIYRKRNGLYSNVLHQILNDGHGRLWISSNRGIFWVRKAQLEAFAQGTTDHVQSISYTTTEGLRSREANGGVQPAGLRARDGRLWFPTQDGASVIDPATIPTDLAPPRVHVEAVSSGDSLMVQRPDGTLRLTASHRSFDVAYTGIRLANSDGVKFRYRLKGLQSEWNEVGGRKRAFFTNVPPGRYTFQVAAQVRGGAWSEPPAQLAVHVDPYFYETWWFYGLCVLTVALGGYGAYRYRVFALRRRQEQLEKKVADRTHELRQTNDQLEAARKEALAAAKAKSQFLANMSHEIRTPLTSIIGFAEAMGEDETSAAHFSPIIEESGKRLLETLDGVLNLSKLEAGQISLDREPIDLIGKMEAVARELHPQAREAGIDLSAEAPASPVQAMADGGGVQIVVRNLISNAIKYTEAGGQVWVRTFQENGQAILEVEDTGVGMDPAMAEDLFEPFRQASEGLRREYEGSGVGLAVTKRAVEEMEGTVEVETEKGEGSRFVVRFPRAGAAETPCEPNEGEAEN